MNFPPPFFPPFFKFREDTALGKEFSPSQIVHITSCALLQLLYASGTNFISLFSCVARLVTGVNYSVVRGNNMMEKN